MVDMVEARRSSASLGLGMQYVLKEYRIFDIWKKMCSAMTSKSVVSEAVAVCKGGTTLNKVYFGNLQRFSEDIDLDICFKARLSREEKIKFIRERILPDLYGTYVIPEEARRKSIIHFDCKFVNDMNAPDSVFIEFNLVDRLTCSVRTAAAKSTLAPLSVGAVPTYDMHYLLADKLRLLYARNEGKDIYDMYAGLRITDQVGEIARHLGGIIAGSGREYAGFGARVSEKLRNAAQMRGVHGSTNPYVPKHLRIGWDEAAAEVLRRIGPALRPRG